MSELVTIAGHTVSTEAGLLTHQESHSETLIDAVALLALVWGAAFVGLAVWAARKSSRRGSRWPGWRLSALVSGICVAAIAVTPVFGDTLASHVGGHVLMMMVAPPLIALGGPLRLLLRSCSREVRRELLEIMADPAVRRLTSSRWIFPVLAVEYYASMAVYLLTPWLDWSERTTLGHVLTHVYFFSCGMSFWSAVIAEDPWARGGRAAGRWAVAAGVPLSLFLGVLAVSPVGPAGPHEATATALSVGVGGSIASLIGLGLLTAHRRKRRRVACRQTGCDDVRKPTAARGMN